jgi:hypothetical protein
MLFPHHRCKNLSGIFGGQSDTLTIFYTNYTYFWSFLCVNQIHSSFMHKIPPVANTISKPCSSVWNYSNVMFILKVSLFMILIKNSRSKSTNSNLNSDLACKWSLMKNLYTNNVNIFHSLGYLSLKQRKKIEPMLVNLALYLTLSSWPQL